MTRWFSFTVACVGIALALLSTGCAPSADESDEGSAAEGEAGIDVEAGTLPDGSSRDDFKPMVELGVGEWTGAKVTAAIAERLIERRLGYPVEQASVVDYDTMLDDLAAGRLDAVLEIWPDTLEVDQRAQISPGSGRVEPLGELGVVGKLGWYIPRVAVDDDPSLTDWSYLADPAVATRFATAETGDRGRFLGTDPAYEQVDEELIAALDLPFEVFYSGSDAATAQELDRAAATGRPILMFWWTPTAEITRFDLVEVDLPPRTAACEAAIEAGDPPACDYPEQLLIKAGWPGLAAEAPEVHAFLQRFTITTADQLALLDQIENQGTTVADAAAGWIDGNRDRWEAWLAEG